MKKTAFFLLFIIMVCALSACSSQQSRNTKGKIFTSVYPVFYLTSRVAENGLEVKTMMPPSADPHNWEPSPKQIAELEGCKLFIFNGAGLEPWTEKVSVMIAEKSIPYLDLSSAIGTQLLTGSEPHSHNVEQNNKQTEPEEKQVYDPHFWLDPMIAQEMAASIKNALVQADPGNSDLYDENYSRLIQDLIKLDEDYSTALGRCKKKEFVVTHQAFGYLAKRYHLRQIPIMGVSAESEPTPSRLAKLTKILEDLDIAYVFTEPFSGSQTAQILASETGVRVLELNPIGGLTKEEQESGADYLSLMYSNLEQLKVALEYEK